MKRFRNVWLALAVCAFLMVGLASPAVAGKGEKEKDHRDKVVQVDREDDRFEAQDAGENEEIAEEEVDEEGAAEAARLTAEAADELAAKQAEAAEKLAEARALLDRAQAEAQANPARAAEILAKAEAKAAELSAKAQELLEKGEAKAVELEAKAEEVLLKAEGDMIANRFEEQAQAAGENGQIYAALGKLFQKGLRELAGETLPAVTEGGTNAAVSADDLAGLLGGEAVLNPETGAFELAFDGGTLSFSPESGVLLDGNAVTAEMLAALPAELSESGAFLRDLLQSTVTLDEQSGLVIVLPEPAPEAPTEPADPVAPTDPTAPIDPTEPVDPVAPTDPAAPDAPAEPVGSDTGI